MSATFAIYMEPYYCGSAEGYGNILTTHEMPPGPLRDVMARVTATRNYAFDNTFNRAGLNGGCCLYGVRNFLCGGRNPTGAQCDWMNPAQLPDLTAYLLGSGYQVESQITNTLRGANVGHAGQNMTLLATYTGKNIPNITYMR
jgi:hypothetical protein